MAHSKQNYLKHNKNIKQWGNVLCYKKNKNQIKVTLLISNT
jgi:hypothetical protein